MSFNIEEIQNLESSFEIDDDVEKIKDKISKTKYWGIELNEFRDFTFGFRQKNSTPFDAKEAFKELDELREYFSDYSIILKEDKDNDNFLYVFQIGRNRSKLYMFNTNFSEDPSLIGIIHH